MKNFIFGVLVTLAVLYPEPSKKMLLNFIDTMHGAIQSVFEKNSITNINETENDITDSGKKSEIKEENVMENYD